MVKTNRLLSTSRGHGVQPRVVIQRIAEAAGRFPSGAEQVLISKSPAYTGALSGDRRALDQLTREWQDAVRMYPSPENDEHTPRRKSGGDPPDVSLAGVATKRELQQAKELLDQTAAAASSDYFMLSCRETLFGSRDALSTHASQSFLASPILRFMSSRELQQLGIPIVGHTAIVAVVRRGVDQRIGHWDELDIKVRWHGGRHTETRKVPSHPLFAVHMRLIELFGNDAATFGLLDYIVQYLVHRDTEGRERRIEVHPGSVLDMVRRTAKRLATRMGWSEVDAVHYSIDGALPQVLPISAKRTTWLSGMDVVTISALPFVSSASISRAYLRALGRGTGRPEKASTLALLEFVEAKTAENDGVRPSWRALWKSWNSLKVSDRPLGWRRSSDYRTMRRTFDRVEKRPTRRRSIIAALRHFG